MAKAKFFNSKEALLEGDCDLNNNKGDMKKYLFFSVMTLFVLFSCSQTKEDKIRNEFKNYVSSNFDDPNSLKEILSIELTDTITYESIRNGVIALHGIDSLTNTIDSIEEKQNEIILGKISTHKYNPYYKDDIMSMALRKAELKRKMVAWIDDYGYGMLRSMSDSTDNLLNRLKGLNIFQYKIKARIKEKDDLKLREYYALEDSVSLRFFDKTPTFYDYSEGTAEFYKVAREYEIIMTIRKNIIDEELELNQKMLRILD